MSGASRREVIAGIGGLGLLAGGLGAGLVAVDRGGASGSDAGAAPARPATLRGLYVAISFPGAEKGRGPTRPAVPLQHGVLADAGGAPIGRFDTSQLEGGRGPAHLQRLELDDGVVIGLGPAAREGTFAIVGATGRFAGAGGAYTVSRTPSGDLEFTFDRLEA